MEIGHKIWGDKGQDPPAPPGTGAWQDRRTSTTSMDSTQSVKQEIRPVSFATGLPWQVAAQKRDLQLLTAAKKGFLGEVADNEGSFSFNSAIHDTGQASLDAYPVGLGWARGAEEEISVVEALRLGADVNAADNNGNTALHYACEEGYTEMAEFLLKCVDINDAATSMMDWTPLHCAASKGRIDIVRALLRTECHINALARDRNTALHLAAMGGHLETLDTLLSNGADPLKQNMDGQTPSDLASLFKNGPYQIIVERLHMSPKPPGRTRKFSPDEHALQITLLEGQDIASMDMGGDSDPYVAIAISNPPGFLRSRTCINTSSPRWDQILFLRINLVPQIMRIEVWDDDFGEKQDDFIGSGAIHLSEFVAQTKAFFAAGGRDGNQSKTDR